MNIVKVDGNWTEGYTLDYHTIYSIPLGEDEYGRMRFDTTRTELGALLYKMKYNGRVDTSAEIVDLISPFLNDWLINKEIDFVIPVPPTEQRTLQPVFAVAVQIAQRYNLGYDLGVFEKISNTPAKNMPKENKNLFGTVKTLKQANTIHNILLVDDLYETGSTANECARLLLQDKNIKNIYYLALTKTR